MILLCNEPRVLKYFLKTSKILNKKINTSIKFSKWTFQDWLGIFLRILWPCILGDALLFPILKENHKDTWGNDNKLEVTSTGFGKTWFRFISYLDKRPVIIFFNLFGIMEPSEMLMKSIDLLLTNVLIHKTVMWFRTSPDSVSSSRVSSSYFPSANTPTQSSVLQNVKYMTCYI